MEELDKQKIFWHSRRGMLELDLLLVPFVDDVFAQLDHEEQVLYSKFLEEEDQDLFAWLLGTAAPPNEAFKKIIAKILAHSKKPT